MTWTQSDQEKGKERGEWKEVDGQRRRRMINQLAISRTSFKVDGGRVRKTGKTKGTVDDAAESCS